MTARVVGLGHVGLYVRDLEKMASFYRDFLGMTVTKQTDGMCFFSTDPQRSDHEIALMNGRPSPEDPHLINQISMRVATLDGLRDFYHRVLDQGYKLDRLVTHVSAIGCYFRDPENNPTEVFWLTGLPSWVNISVPIDVDRPDDEIMAEINRYWDLIKHVEVGEKPDDETQALINDLRQNGVAALAH